MNVLATGAGGFVGTGLVNRLLSADAPFPALTSLTVVDRRLTDLLNDTRVCALEVDCGDPQLLGEAMGSDLDLIFHLARMIWALRSVQITERKTLELPRRS